MLTPTFSRLWSYRDVVLAQEDESDCDSGFGLVPNKRFLALSNIFKTAAENFAVVIKFSGSHANSHSHGAYLHR